MNKGDKIIVVFGVIILISASIGIYFWVEEEPEDMELVIDDFFEKEIYGEMSAHPEAISVSDTNPFYTIMTTPIAIHFDKDCNKFVSPVYITNSTKISSSVDRLENLLHDDYKVDEWIPGEKSRNNIKDASVYLARKFWNNSNGVILIHNKTGYNLSVIAAPIASYLGIPIIVTDELDAKVIDTLNELDVQYSIICGELNGYKKFIKFEDTNVDELINFSISIIRNKLGHDINYITITNPRDIHKPAVLNYTQVLYKKGTLSSGNLFPSNILDVIRGDTKTYKFKIPEDYKYALIKLELRNLENPEEIEKFGDNIMISGSLTGYMRTLASPGDRDKQGNLECDKLYFETIFYDSPGEELTISLTSTTHTVDKIHFELIVTVEKLDNPYYPFMKQFSSIAPYLTAYREGIVYAKSDFAFVANDDVILNGKSLPGNTQVFYNPMLIPVINQHVYENIHKPLNQLISYIKDIDINELEILTNKCSIDPIYIALVGDTTMIPQYYYRSPHSDPYSKPKTGSYGTNCPSDFIYGNIDPEIYSLRPYNRNDLENDLYSEFPQMENIVGRISGWDIQDASALITRTIFYDKIIDAMGDQWKENALVMTGAGTEVQRIPLFNWIQEKMGHSDPMKFPSGEKKFLIQRIEENLVKGGFSVTTTQRGKSQRVGYSNEALKEIKTDGLLNRIFFPYWTVKIRQHFENFNSLLDPKWWAEALFTDGSDTIRGGTLQQESNLIISDQHAIWFEIEHGDILMYSLGGPKIIYELLSRFIPVKGRFSTPLDSLGAYSVRDVSNMEMGPSVMLIEGCGSGKIDGFHPKNALANAYLHAGVNAYISPTTLSAFYGALEPRFGNGVGFGIIGYIKAAIEARQGIYPPVYFNQYIFEELCKHLYKDKDIGTALKEAKNDYLRAQFNIPFRWTPPLSIPSNLPDDLEEDIINSWSESAINSMDTYPVEKYCTIYQINLLGDPAFSPYIPVIES
jgi:hypothetical protein